MIGPISLDLALSPSSRVRKNSRSLPLVHVLLAPDIVVANVMFKAFQLAGGCHAAGIVVSDEMVAAVPSRSGSTIEKALSVALARLVKNSRFKPHASGAGLHG